MKKTLFIGLVALCAGSFSAKAQISYGVHGSFILSNMKFDADNAEGAPVDFENATKTRPSFRAGITATIPVGETFAFMPQLNYVSGGVKFEANESYSEGDETVSATVKGAFKPSFLELPLNFVYTASLSNGSKFFAGVGPSVSMGLGGKYELKAKLNLPDDPEMPEFPELNVSDGKIKFDGKKASETPDDDTDIHFNRFNFGGNVVAGYQLENGLFIQANYNHGFSNLSPDEGGKIRTRYFGIGIGYFFK